MLSFSGYLLPWDQLSLWAVTIGASMVEAFPPEVVGRTMNLIVRGGPEFNADGLLRFYLLHVVLLPFLGMIFFGVHYYKVIHHGHSLPPQAEEVGQDTAKRVPMDSRVYFMPRILTRELYYVLAIVALFVVAAVFFYEAPLELHADPLVTPLHTTAPWYFLWLQGMLKLGDKVIWGVIVPTILVLLLVALPYFEVGPSRRYGDRRIGLSVAAMAVAGMAILSFMGTPWYGVSTAPEQEAVATLLPQTHPGPLREADWEALELGTFAASEYASAPNPEMASLLETFHEEVLKVNDAARTDAEGYFVIEDWQSDLKKVTLRVVWDNAADGSSGEYSQITFLHSDSAYDRGGSGL